MASFIVERQTNVIQQSVFNLRGIKNNDAFHIDIVSIILLL